MMGHLRGGVAAVALRDVFREEAGAIVQGHPLRPVAAKGMLIPPLDWGRVRQRPARDGTKALALAGFTGFRLKGRPALRTNERGPHDGATHYATFVVRVRAW